VSKGAPNLVGSREESYLGPELKKRIDQIIASEVEDATKKGYRRSRSAILRMLLVKGVEAWQQERTGEKS
jgi:hypothetical protein